MEWAESRSRQTFIVRILFVICSLCAALAALSCSNRKSAEARRLLDGLPPELVQHLVSSDDSTLARYGRDTGFETLHGMNNQLGERIVGLWVRGQEQDAVLLENYRFRLARVFSTVYRSDFYLHDIAYLRSLPEETRDLAMRTRHEYSAVQLDRTLNPEAAVETHTRYARSFESLGDANWAAMAKLNMSDAYERAGDVSSQKRYLIEACSDFQKVGRNKMACEALGRLGSRYEKWGQPDSMAVCYEQAFKLAFEHRMGYQAARILEFYAGYYGRMGRLDLQRRLLDEAMDVARTYDPGCYEVRFLKEAMRFNAGLGCWDVVENLVTQVRGIEPRCKYLNLAYGEVHMLRTDVFDAQVKMASGDTARADEILRSVTRRLPTLRLPDSYRGEDDEYSYYRAEGLLSNGRPGDAMQEAMRKLSQPPEESLPLWSSRLSLVAAKAAYRVGELDTALDAIGRFDRFAVGEETLLRTELSERDALLGMIALSRGDTTGAIESAAKGLGKLRASAMSIDASVGSYLWLTRSDLLRQLLHDLASADALAGYGAEIYWRELYELLGQKERNESALVGARSGRPPRAAVPVPVGKTLLGEFRSLGRRALGDIGRLDAVHCVYLVRDKEIWRWTASRAGIRRDVLPTGALDLRALVAGALTLMSTYPENPDAPVDEPLRENLRKLARVLLPPEVLASPEAPAGTQLFLVTADNFLASIPFETFDVGLGQEYEPLLERRNLAYVRHVRGSGDSPAGAKGVILVNPDLPRDYRGGVRPLSVLPEADEEGKAVSALDPSAVLLTGESATKQRFTSVWGDASYLYIAAHTVSGLPYLATLVLAEPGGDAAPDAAVLDVTDIRAADLRKCRVVVLSGCSSGAPYVAANGAAPSLGDAFLDAGAGAVVHTFWDVKDEDARRIGTSFIEKWTTGKYSEIRALSEVRRSEIHGPAGVRHPSRWATYAIKVSRL